MFIGGLGHSSNKHLRLTITLMQLQIKHKIGLGFAIPILLIAGTVGFLVTMFGEIDHLSDEVVEHSIPFVQQAAALKLDVVEVQQWLTDISATRAAEGFDDGFAEAAIRAENFHEGIAFLRDALMKEGDNAGVQELDNLATKFDEYYAMGIEMAKAYIEGGPVEGNKAMGGFDVRAAALAEAIEPFLERQTVELLAGMGVIQEKGGQLRWLALICTVLTTVICLVLLQVISSGINRSLGAIRDGMTSVASGDLTNHIQVSASDELGALANQSNEFVTKVGSSLTEVAGCSKRLDVGADRVAGASQRLAEGATEQSATFKQVLDMLEAIIDSSQRVEQKTAQANSLAIAACEFAKTCAGEMDNMATAMVGIQESGAANSHAAMAKLLA